MSEAKWLTEALARPFQVGEVKFKPQSVKGNRALALAYIDCRVIQDRLDEVLGSENWADDYDILPDGSVMCRLKLRLGGEWVTKVDVGSPSEQPDGGDRLKAAFSDAMKRAAVKFGIGRYLYRLPAVWCDYDPQKRQFSGTPQLPAWAVPKGKPNPPAAAPAAAKAPATGTELQKRLLDFEAKLFDAGRCKAGELLAYVVAQGVRAGFAQDITKWDGTAIAWAVDAVKRFDAEHPAAKGQQQLPGTEGRHGLPD